MAPSPKKSGGKSKAGSAAVAPVEAPAQQQRVLQTRSQKAGLQVSSRFLYHALGPRYTVPREGDLANRYHF